MSAFVIDASIAAAWLLPDERSVVADLAFDRLRNEGAIAPALFGFEIRELIVSNECRGRPSPSQAAEAGGALHDLSIALGPIPLDDTPLFALARKYRLTIYDAAYLALAIAERTPLATLDGALIAAARAEGVGSVGYSAA